MIKCSCPPFLDISSVSVTMAPSQSSGALGVVAGHFHILVLGARKRRAAVHFGENL